MKIRKLTLITLLCCYTLCLTAQKSTQAGPVFAEFGKVYKVPEANFKSTLPVPMKALFDISRQFKDREGPNPLLETAARYYNLHVQNGYEISDLKAALVVHGSAVNDLLTNEYFVQKYSKDNPNADLVRTLIKNEVRVILCGQSARYYDVDLDKVPAGVEMALSAMTALIQLQNEGYRLIHFQ